MVLAESLERISKGYIIDTAGDASQALDKIEKSNYALMITDYRMPGMNGLDLAIAARRIAPKMQIVLMTAYGTDRLQNAAGEIGVDGYISKPFTMAQIRAIVERAIEKTENNEGSSHANKRAFERPVYDQLKNLQANTGARTVLLISSSGYPVETCGQTNNIDVTSVGALVAANFMAAAELANKLGKGTIFKSSYHEGQGGTDYNLYAYDVNGDLLLVVVFGAESKAGAVWFYTKQTAAVLEALMGKDLVTTTLQIPPAESISENMKGFYDSDAARQESISADSMASRKPLGQDFQQYLSKELDNLLEM